MIDDSYEEINSLVKICNGFQDQLEASALGQEHSKAIQNLATTDDIKISRAESKNSYQAKNRRPKKPHRNATPKKAEPKMKTEAANQKRLDCL